MANQNFTKMSDFRSAGHIFVSDLGEVKYHSNVQEINTFCHLSSTSSSQGCVISVIDGLCVG